MAEGQQMQVDRLKRREFISLVGGASVAWPLAARAQQPTKIPRVGLLSTFSPSETRPWHQALRQGLRDLGWVEGENISIEYRYAEGRLDRLPALATDLVRLQVDLIFTDTTSPALAVKNVTRTIPIVVASASDFIETGLAQSLARPGGNITGLDQIAPELGGKRLELLKQIMPQLARAAVVRNPATPASIGQFSAIQALAQSLRVEVSAVDVRDTDEIERAVKALSSAGNGGLIVAPSAGESVHRGRVVELAAKYKLPAVYSDRFNVTDGGLVSYGPDRIEQLRGAARYVDRILKGEKIAGLPVQAPTKFQLVINLKTTKALGIELPASLLATADEVIE
jgi:putative ABC transport system substrate-binding protein